MGRGLEYLGKGVGVLWKGGWSTLERGLEYSAIRVGVLTWARRLEYLDRGGWSTSTVHANSNLGLEVRENIRSEMGIGE